MRSLAHFSLVALLLIASGSGAQQAGKTDPKKVDPKKNDPPESKFNMKMTIADVRLGTQVMGTKVSQGDLKGRVVLVDYWGINCPPCLKCMPMTAALNSELSDFGLLVLGSHRQGGTADEIKAAAVARGANFPISLQTNVVGSDDNRLLPHCILFDHTGTCIFRGSPFEVDALIRVAVGKAIVEGAEREKFTTAVTPIVQDLKKGKTPLSVLPRLVSLQNATGEVGVDAKALLASLTAAGQKKIDRATELLDSEPFEAYLLVEKLPTAYKGTPVAVKANEMLVKLKKDKSVTTELAARPSLDLVHKFEQQLAARPGADDPKKAEFQKANALLLKQLKDKVQQMSKSWPDAKATQEAVTIGEKFAASPK